jgi:tRNA G18 (ribose-2'-O)-methylase SpoU
MEKTLNEDLNRLNADEFKQAEKLPIIVILDDIRSLNNIGSVFRTSDAFRISKIYLCGITATPPHRDIQKTALGATETVAWEHRENIISLIEELKITNTQVYAVEQAQNSTMLHQFSISNKMTEHGLALIFGNEVFGVKQEAINICHGVIEIPQHGTKHSLNIAVSAGVVLWDVFVKMNVKVNLL